MTRRTRSIKIETRSARLRLPIRPKPYFVKIARGLALGYRRTQSAGTWTARVTRDGEDWTERLGSADDYADSDGKAALTYDEAADRAKAILNAGKSTGDGTVLAAIDRYEAALQSRGGDTMNADRVRCHLSTRLGAKMVAALTYDDLTAYRDQLLSRMKPASAKRTANTFKAALNLAATVDQRVKDRPWVAALQIAAADGGARNVVLSDRDRRTLIAAAYRAGAEFGLLVEVLDETGSRPSQVVRLTGDDVQADFRDPRTGKRAPRLMVPVSRKGRGGKPLSHRPVPISIALADKLRGRTGLLLRREDGRDWATLNLAHYYVSVARGAQFENPDRVTLYALRHTSIVRQLMANVPIRVVAALHDTSVAMIERNYSRFISDYADDLARAALPTPTGEVVPLPQRA